MAVCYAACAWAILFGAPHLWWALGYPAGFPGGDASYHRFMSSAWRYWYDVLVVLLSVAGVFVASRLRRPGTHRRSESIAAWVAAGALTTRGLAGMIVDGRNDPVWSPAFLLGGMLFGSVAWLSREPMPRD